MPKRFLVEEIRSSRTRARMSPEACVLWDNLITVADDFGIFEADPEVCCNTAFQRRPKWLTGPEQVGKLLDELSRDGEDGDPSVILLYSVGRTTYGIFRPGAGWRKSQGDPRAKRTKHPLPHGITVDDLLHAPENVCEQMRANVLAFASAFASASASAFASDLPAPTGAGPSETPYRLTPQAIDRKGKQNGLKHISPTTPTDGLDEVDLCRRRYAAMWADEGMYENVPYPDQPGADRKAIGELLGYHRRNKLAYPWKAWVSAMFAAYLEIRDDKLVTGGGHALRFLPGSMTRIVPKVAREMKE